jgi:arsenical pump membrane protein
MDSSLPFVRAENDTILGGRDPFTGFLWLVAVGLLVIACSVHSATFESSVAATAQPFITLAAVLAIGIAGDRAGLFRWIAQVAIPDKASSALALAGVLTITAFVSGLVNLDVAVVVAVPLALAVASTRHLSAPWMVMGVALTANATSFLLPTSNITNLLVLGSSVPS